MILGEFVRESDWTVAVEADLLLRDLAEELRIELIRALDGGTDAGLFASFAELSGAQLLLRSLVGGPAYFTLGE